MIWDIRSLFAQVYFNIFRYLRRLTSEPTFTIIPCWIIHVDGGESGLPADHIE